jgi:2-C-methyl-D-erythritol 4-phosphate cytidylyltransferase
VKFEKCVSVILLAGGKGTRMQSPLPKQFMQLGPKPIACYSFDLFVSMPEIQEIIVVCEESFRPLFETQKVYLHFADPGSRRQDSVYQGFKCVDPKAKFVCIHDSARPFLTDEMVKRALQSADEVGAAAVGMPIKYTLKECEENGLVVNTPPRARFWEIQTPQIIKPHLLLQGFEKAMASKLTVTDDLSLVELIPHPVKLVEGSYNNIKITTPEDLAYAKALCTITN